MALDENAPHIAANLDLSDTPNVPSRRGGRLHPPTTLDTVYALLRYFNTAAAHLQSPEDNPAADTSALLSILPHGSLTEATVRMTDRGEVVSWRVGDRNPRDTPSEGVLLLLVFPLFGGFPYIDTDRKGGQELHYVELFEDGLTLQRIMAGAGAGEAVRHRRGADHHDLCPWSLEIIAGNPRVVRNRETAISLALAEYRKNAKAWGLDFFISEAEYEALLRGSLRLFDAVHGKHFLRKVGRLPSE